MLALLRPKIERNVSFSKARLKDTFPFMLLSMPHGLTVVWDTILECEGVVLSSLAPLIKDRGIPAAPLGGWRAPFNKQLLFLKLDKMWLPSLFSAFEMINCVVHRYHLALGLIPPLALRPKSP